ncbi:MAG: hypothetical protein J3K34DRAFT_522853 [Monoraphidium minutum]|nr:MAG: hypothetical protein J3K34DRAFT_522853 [Monoraphidium minutum]
MDVATRLLWGWDARVHAPDQLGKVFVITGANSGIGFEAALRLAERNATVVMGVRNLDAGNRAAEAIRHRAPGAKVLVLHVNMASFRSIRAFASRVSASFPRGISCLVNNAGVLNPPVSPLAAVSEDGFEVTRAVDFFGPALLTHLLLPSLAAAAPARVVSVTSLGEAVGSLDWKDLKGLLKPATTFRAYGDSKLMLLMWTRELNRRLRGTGIDAFVVHPGVSHTPGEWKTWRGRASSWAAWLGALLHGQTVGWAATSTLYAATEPRLASRGGAYIGPRYAHVFGYAGSNTAARVPLNPAAWDAAAARRLFDETTALLLAAGGAGGGAGAAEAGGGAAPGRLPSPGALAGAARAGAGPLGTAGAKRGGPPAGAGGALPPLGADGVFEGELEGGGGGYEVMTAMAELLLAPLDSAGGGANVCGFAAGGGAALDEIEALEEEAEAEAMEVAGAVLLGAALAEEAGDGLGP